MDDSAEQIEARLAAYVDGELDADERAEIERHLAEHLGHLALIKDLMAHRQVLVSLPRERAPRDMNEPMEVQLEREALLGEGDPITVLKKTRVRRWPQLLAVAAIIAMALGLGAMVYFVLPPKHPTVMVVANTEDMGGSASGRQMKRDGVAAGGPRAELNERSDKSAAVADAAAAKVLAVARDVEMRQAEADGARVPESAVALDAVAQSEERLADSSVGTSAVMTTAAAPRAEAMALNVGDTQGGGTLVVTITAPDVSEANAALLSYFTTNGIAWRETPAAPIGSVLAGVETYGRVEKELVMREAVAGGQNEPPAPAQAADRSERPLAERKSTAAGAAGSELLGRSAERPALSRARAGPTPPPAPAEDAVAEKGRESETGVTRSRVAAVTIPGADAKQEALAGINVSGAYASATSGRGGGAMGGTTDQVIVLASIDGNQATQLANTLSRPAMGRRAEVRRVGASPVDGAVVGLKSAQGLLFSKEARAKEAADDNVDAIEYLRAARREVAAAGAQGQTEAFTIVPSTQPVVPHVTAVELTKRNATAAEGMGARADERTLTFDAPGAAAATRPFSDFNCVIVIQKAAPADAARATTVPATQPVEGRR